MQDLSTEEKRQHIKAELESVRNSTRLQAHLLSMEAQAQWKKLESKLVNFEKKLDRGTQAVTAAAFDKAKEFAQSTRKFFKEQSLLAPELKQPVSTIADFQAPTCGGTQSANSAAQVLWDQGLKALPVVDADNRPIGLLTDRDLCMAAYTQGKTLHELSVHSAMNAQFESCNESTTIREAIEIMTTSSSQTLVVVDQSGLCIGLLTLAHVARCIYRKTGGLYWASPSIARLVGEIGEPVTE